MIREARPGEYDAAGRVTVDAYRALFGDRLGGYADILADARSRAAGAVLLVAVHDGRVVGTVTYVQDGSSSYAEDLRDGEAGIRMLAVSPDAQRTGTGTALVEACIERARTSGRRAVCLHSDGIMRTAHRIYAKLGFVRDPARDWTPREGISLLAFRLDLDR